MMEARYLKKSVLIRLVVLALQTQTALLLKGRPGMSKSAHFKAIGKALGWPVYIVPVPGKRDPAQVQGMPRVVTVDIGGKSHEVVKWIPYEWVVRAMHDPHCIVVLEDIGESDRSMQSYFLEFTYNRILGDCFLENASVCAAANPVDGSLELTEALSSRFFHLDWAISPEEFADALLDEFPAADIPKVPSDWQRFKRPWEGMWSSYIRQIPDFNQPSADRGEVADDELIVGNMRTVKAAVDLLACLDASRVASPMNESEYKDAQVAIVNGTVGKAMAGAFFTYSVYGKDLPTVEQVLDNPRIIRTKGLYSRIDYCWVISTTVIRHALWKNDRETWLKAWKVLAAFAENDKSDIGTRGARCLHRYRPEGVSKDELPTEASHYRIALGLNK